MKKEVTSGAANPNTFSNISGDQLKYIIIRHFVEGIRPLALYREITDPDAYEKYGVDPIGQLSSEYFARCLRFKIPKELIKEYREMWVTNLLAEPLANKRVRIRTLAQHHAETKSILVKAKILKLIKEEVGEDATLEAIKKSGSTINIGTDLTPDMLKKLALTIIQDDKSEEA